MIQSQIAAKFHLSSTMLLCMSLYLDPWVGFAY